MQAGGASLGLAPLRDGTGSAATIKRILKRDAPRPLNIHGARSAPAPSKRQNRFAAGARGKNLPIRSPWRSPFETRGSLGRWFAAATATRRRAFVRAGSMRTPGRDTRLPRYTGPPRTVAGEPEAGRGKIRNDAPTSFGVSREPAVARHRPKSAPPCASYAEKACNPGARVQELLGRIRRHRRSRVPNAANSRSYAAPD